MAGYVRSKGINLKYCFENNRENIIPIYSTLKYQKCHSNVKENCLSSVAEVLILNILM